MGKNDKTAKQQPEGNGDKYTPIYLVLNGNNITVNNYYLRTAIEEAHEYGSPLYVTSNAGAPKDPPPCPPNFPNCHG
jgi:hypothetical protein